MLKSVLSVSHPDVLWYRLNGMGAQKHSPKKVLVTLSLNIFHVKTKWNIVYEYLKTKTFSRDTNIHLQCTEHQIIFDPQLGRIWVSLNYLVLKFKKTVCPKIVSMRHWLFAVMKDICFGHQKRITIHSRLYIVYKYPLVISTGQ